MSLEKVAGAAGSGTIGVYRRSDETTEWGDMGFGRSDTDVVISTPLRTAIGTFGGSLKDVPATDLGATVGKAVTLVGYDEDGRAELFFDDPFTHDSSHTHSIWVAPEFIAPVEE